MKNIFIICILSLVFCFPRAANADKIYLRMPSYFDGEHDYYYELLEMALHNAGHEVTIDKVAELPTARERKMLEDGDLSIGWYLQSSQRDNQYVPIPVNITNGLIGKRILLVPPEDLHAYKDVKTLDDFRALNKVGAFGWKWYDAVIWEKNGLPFKEVLNWRNIFKMIAHRSRGIDYFSRGFNEIVNESRANKELVIEPHLLLEYKRDFIFYLSPKFAHLRPIIEEALLEAKKSGLMDELLRKHWVNNFEILQPEKRTILKLKDPSSE
ncbi:hypothetical protein [Maridesulfovibrio frigidus]|uniref:hypothetical protein n=1 Tax=Maridesulfovibrio frigidus TaxID=340956 RepID=UPI000691F34C|nr:hypothetical protein [Maridesulfovibrio frigidus]